MTGVWSDEDSSVLEKLLKPLYRAVRPEPLGMFGGEARGLVCCPKGEVYDRALTFLTTLNVMAGLVLGAIAGLVQSPLNVEALPEEKRFLGELYNILAYFSVTNQICVVMFSTYMLFMLVAHGHTPEIVYRSITYGSTLIGASMLAVYIPLLVWLFMMVLTAHIFFSFWAAWTCTGVVAVIYGAFHMIFGNWGVRAFPRGFWSWVAVTTPWAYCSSRARSDVARFANLYQATAASGALAGMGGDNDGTVDGERAEPTPQEAELLAVVDAALPQLGEAAAGARRTQLLRALTAEGLTRERLTKVAKMENGFRVLMDLFDFDSDERGVQLTKGERVALALATGESFAGEKTWC